MRRGPVVWGRLGGTGDVSEDGGDVSEEESHLERGEMVSRQCSTNLSLGACWECLHFH